MSWVNVGAAAVSVVSGAVQAKGSKDAAKDATRTANNQARQDQRNIEQARSDTAPFRDASYQALENMMLLTGQRVPGSVSSAAAGGVGRTGGTDDLSLIPDTRWNGKPVYRDHEGNIFSGRGDNWTAASGVEKIGNINDLSPGSKVVFEGKGLRYKGGAALRAGEGGALSSVRGDSVSEMPTAPQVAAQGAASQPQSIEAMVKADPSYQFRLNEGQRAVERGAAARGGALSGGAHKELARYAQNYASTEYQNIYARIAQIAGYGPGAVNTATQAGYNYNAQTAAAQGAASGTRQSAYTNQANIWSNVIGSVGQSAGAAYQNWRGGNSSGGGGGAMSYDWENVDEWLKGQ